MTISSRQAPAMPGPAGPGEDTPRNPAATIPGGGDPDTPDHIGRVARP
jgi:hypothetical protein